MPCLRCLLPCDDVCDRIHCRSFSSHVTWTEGRWATGRLAFVLGPTMTKWCQARKTELFSNLPPSPPLTTVQRRRISFQEDVVGDIPSPVPSSQVILICCCSCTHDLAMANNQRADHDSLEPCSLGNGDSHGSAHVVRPDSFERSPALNERAEARRRARARRPCGRRIKPRRPGGSDFIRQ